MAVLGIETSCDDTSLALYSAERGVIEVLTASQLIHERYGGVVPEIASRQHVKTILSVFRGLLARAGFDRSEVQSIGVSNGPGLIGSLLVGVGFAKGLAFSLGIPVVGVHHIEAHILSNELGGEKLSYPCLVLVVSGGHTSLYLLKCEGQYELRGCTRDDAAGEAFDKIAKLLGLGFPGGPAIQKAAESGDGSAVRFPRAMIDRDDFDFSFSGLKTAVRLHVMEAGKLKSAAVADVAASAQAAIVEVLIHKTMACALKHGVKDVYLAGGVAANGPLRSGMKSACDKKGVTYHAPLLEYCTDNGAMVARAALRYLTAGRDDGLSLDVFARGELSTFSS